MSSKTYAGSLRYKKVIIMKRVLISAASVAGVTAFVVVVKKLDRIESTLESIEFFVGYLDQNLEKSLRS